jgi:hypothetical protein
MFGLRIKANSRRQGVVAETINVEDCGKEMLLKLIIADKKNLTR